MRIRIHIAVITHSEAGIVSVRANIDQALAEHAAWQPFLEQVAAEDLQEYELEWFEETLEVPESK